MLRRLTDTKRSINEFNQDFPITTLEQLNIIEESLTNPSTYRKMVYTAPTVFKFVTFLSRIYKLITYIYSLFSDYIFKQI